MDFLVAIAIPANATEHPATVNAIVPAPPVAGSLNPGVFVTCITTRELVDTSVLALSPSTVTLDSSIFVSLPSTVALALAPFVSIMCLFWLAALSLLSYSVVLDGVKSSSVHLILMVIGSFNRLKPASVRSSVRTYSSASRPLMMNVPSLPGVNTVPPSSVRGLLE